MDIREGLTFDDVLLVPKFSDVSSRSQTDLSTQLSRNISINIPLISANMDTVTESSMAVAITFQVVMNLMVSQLCRLMKTL